MANQPQVAFTQGVLLDLRKEADRTTAVIGDLVHYTVRARNRNDQTLEDAVILDWIPPNFRFVKGSALWNGQAIPDPTGNRPLRFDVGDVGGFVDANGNQIRRSR